MKNISFISKLFFLLLTVILLISVIITANNIYNGINIQDINIELKESNTDNYVKQIKFFIPVVGIKSKIDNIDKNITENKTLNIIKQDISDLNEIVVINELKEKKINIFDTYTELVSFLNKNLNEIGIINIDNLDINLKAIPYEGLFLLDKNINYDEYKLKLTKYVNNEKKSLITNFDSTKLFNIGHVGSLIPARGVDFYIKKYFNGDFKLLFKNTKSLFDSIDIMSTTFEAPVLGKGRYCSSCTVFVGDESFLEAVEYSGLDIFSLASNHIMDGGVEALANTQKLLDNINVLHTGASTKNNDDAAKPILVELNGIKIAYLAFNDTPGLEQWANENKPGAANISDWIIDQNGNTIKYEPNEERIKYFLNRAKSLNPDLIVILMHWGSVEYQPVPTPYTEKLAKLLTKYGADIIFGDHPHWVQKIEIIDNKPIFYSVGNFVFDQTWSIETMQGIVVEVFLYDKKIINYRLHPHQLDLVKNGTIKLLDKSDDSYYQVLERIYKVSNF